jgi:hypothetical protein
MNMRPRRSTWVLMASFVLTLVIYLMVSPAPVVTNPNFPVPVTNSPAEPRSRPTLDTTSTEPARPSTTPTRTRPLSSTAAPTSTPTRAPTKASTPTPSSTQPVTTGSAQATTRP